MAIIYGTASANTLRGTSLADTLYGRAGNDTLYGNAGNDRLDGGTGIDLMIGGTGDDVYIVDNIADEVRELAGEGYDTVRASTHYALPAGSFEQLTTTNTLGTARIDLIGNGEANLIRGNAGSNWLSGGGGADVLAGMDGDDFLIGGSGRDRLVGGAGADVFIFSDTLDRDTISDFVSGEDVIDLGWFVGDNFEFIGSAAFGGNPGEGRYANGLFQLDIDGDRVADLSIASAGQIAAGDFVFAAYGAWDYWQ